MSVAGVVTHMRLGSALTPLVRRWPDGVPADVQHALAVIYGVAAEDVALACAREVEVRRAYFAALAERRTVAP